MPDKYIYLSKLLFLSTSLHAFFLMVLLLTYQHHHPNRFSFVINHRLDTAKIKLLPLIKTVSDGLTTLAESGQQDKLFGKKTEFKNSTVQKKNAPKKVESPKTALVQKVQKHVAKPQVLEKKAQKIVEQKPEFPKQQEKKAEQPKPIAQKQVEQPKEDDVIYLGRDDLVLLALHNRVQEEIQKTWHPPVGLSKDLACTIKVKINNKGLVADFVMEESSRVISYDISARMALSTMSFPKELWAKEVVITFKQ